MKKLFFILSIVLVFLITNCEFGTSQQNKQELSHQSSQQKSPEIKNIILMIGDGMGVYQIYAGLTANHGELNLEKCTVAGFSKTYSSNKYITDSGAGGTALSCGQKTKNLVIGVDSLGNPITNIIELAEKHNLSTGLVSTSAITHATPASFIAHVKHRNQYEDIAAWFLKTDIDVFIGGGEKHFNKRDDNRDLLNELAEKGYSVKKDMTDIMMVSQGKLAGLTAPEHNPRVSEGRGTMLPDATKKAIELLSQNEKGFFLMVEGSQIDWGGHDNDTDYIIEEMIDFDEAIGVALDFAEKDGETLVVITADHECGGFVVLDGNFEKGKVRGKYTTKHHTGVMVPVLAYGPGAIEFGGIYENTDIFHKMVELLKLDKDLVN